MKPRVLTGTPGAPGYCKGKVRILKGDELTSIKKFSIEGDQIPAELTRYKEAVQTSKQQLKTLISNRAPHIKLEIGNVFEAHILLFDDPDYNAEIEKKLRAKKFNIEAIVAEVTLDYHKLFKNLKDRLFQERAVDILDVGKRLLKNLRREAPPDPIDTANAPPNYILVGREITPSDTISIARSQLLGILSEQGGPTAHATILSRALKIPYVFGIEDILEKIPDGTDVLIDAVTGNLYLDPTEEEVQKFQKIFEDFQREFLEVQSELVNVPTRTRDGQEIILQANLTYPEELTAVKEYGLKGIGLYRTEIQYINSTELPLETDLFAAYRAVFETASPLPVTVRTFDFGADKAPLFLKLPHENNPDLGCRAIRLALREPEFFKTQLRAILRAAHFGAGQLLIPMITCLIELRKVKEILQSCYRELDSKGVPYRKLPLGIMVEVPAVVLQLEHFLPEVDFINIGTNDLMQYLLAVDRNNSRVSYLYNPCHPAVVRALHTIIETANRFKKEVCLCGEIAGDPAQAPLLLLLGLKKFSMNPHLATSVKEKILGCNLSNAEHWREKLLQCPTAMDVAQLIEKKSKIDANINEFHFF